MLRQLAALVAVEPVVGLDAPGSSCSASSSPGSLATSRASTLTALAVVLTAVDGIAVVAIARQLFGADAVRSPSCASTRWARRSPPPRR